MRACGILPLPTLITLPREAAAKPAIETWAEWRVRVPAITVIVDTPDHVGASFGIVSALTPVRGLVTSETVPVILE